MVGTSGKSGERLRLVTPSARNLPEVTYGSDVLTWSYINCTLPATTSTMAAALPLYGTCSIFTPACRLKSSPAICPVLPAPDVPHASCDGRAFASTINSFTERTGSDGVT